MGGSLSPVSESMALALNQKGSFKNRKNQSAGKYVCDYCGESGHSKQHIYELIGYPDWWDFSKKPCKKNVITPIFAIVESFTSESKSNVPTAHVAHSGGGKGKALSTFTENNGWIIDTGASYHMIGNSNH